ncbi:MAG: helix-turn-helix transcriptional regulator [Chloroflexota bacterium]
MSRAENKADRLLKMEMLLLNHPEGLTQAQIARRLGVDRSVIHRNLPDFERLYPTILLEDGRICLDRSAYLIKIALSLNEAVAVHLAARLMATRMDRHNPHAASALRKLGVALEKLAPRISKHVRISADVMDEADQRQDPNFLRALEILTIAWAEERKTQIWYRKENGQISEYFFAPYLIEPYAIGQTVYGIGYCEPPGALRTFKVERIERIEMTQIKYSIPVDFSPVDLFKNAWGIWFTDGEPVEVVLKFSPRVAQRVGETRWHRSEQVAVQQDGSLLWRARIAEPQEMMPWIRGWGADCEVLQPESLRKTLEQEVRKLVEVYQLSWSETIQ